MKNKTRVVGRELAEQGSSSRAEEKMIMMQMDGLSGQVGCIDTQECL